MSVWRSKNTPAFKLISVCPPWIVGCGTISPAVQICISELPVSIKWFEPVCSVCIDEIISHHVWSHGSSCCSCSQVAHLRGIKYHPLAIFSIQFNSKGLYWHESLSNNIAKASVQTLRHNNNLHRIIKTKCLWNQGTDATPYLIYRPFPFIAAVF